MPIQEGKKIFLGGKFVDYNFAPIGYGGSSAVVPPEYRTLRSWMEEIFGDSITFVKKARDADIAILTTGFTHAAYEDREGWDKSSIQLKKKQIKEIISTAYENPNTIVVLYGGSATQLDPWIKKVAGLLVVWQPHQMGGAAIANVLKGIVTPSGKLPITFPKVLEHIPAHSSDLPKGRNYPAFRYGYIQAALHEQIYIYRMAKHAKRPDVYYDEGIYVGYRHFDKNEIEPEFPFGFGLSYTTFEYSNLKVGKDQYTLNDTIEIAVSISNKGKYDGAEVVQVYFHDQKCELDRPPKELCGFAKVFLKAGEQKEVKINVPVKQLRYYNPEKKQWCLEPGAIDLLVASSSSAKDIKLKKTIQIV